MEAAAAQAGGEGSVPRLPLHPPPPLPPPPREGPPPPPPPRASQTRAAHGGVARGWHSVCRGSGLGGREAKWTHTLMDAHKQRTPLLGHRVPTLGSPLAPTRPLEVLSIEQEGGRGGEGRGDKGRGEREGREGREGGPRCGSLATLIRFQLRGLGLDPGMCHRFPWLEVSEVGSHFLCSWFETHHHGEAQSVGPRERRPSQGLPSSRRYSHSPTPASLATSGVCTAA